MAATTGNKLRTLGLTRAAGCFLGTFLFQRAFWYILSNSCVCSQQGSAQRKESPDHFDYGGSILFLTRAALFQASVGVRPSDNKERVRKLHSRTRTWKATPTIEVGVHAPAKEILFDSLFPGKV
jgi:hypothetical protein